MMLKHVPQAGDHAALIVDESPVSTQGVITAITHIHGSFLQLEIIHRRDSMDGCLLGSRIGGSTSYTSGSAIPRLDCQLQAADDLFRRFKSVRALSRQSNGFRLDSEDRLFSDSMTSVVFNAGAYQVAASTWVVFN